MAKGSSRSSTGGFWKRLSGLPSESPPSPGASQSQNRFADSFHYAPDPIFVVELDDAPPASSSGAGAGRPATSPYNPGLRSDSKSRFRAPSVPSSQSPSPSPSPSSPSLSASQSPIPRIIYANPAFLRILGRSLAEVMDSPLDLGSMANPVVLAAIQSVREQGLATHREIALGMDRVHMSWMDLNVWPWLDSSAASDIIPDGDSGVIHRRLLAVSSKVTGNARINPAAPDVRTDDSTARRHFLGHVDQRVTNCRIMVGQLRDLTEYKSVEAQLRHSDQQLRTVVSHAPIVLSTLDSAGRIMLAEGKGLEALRVTPEQLVGESMLSLNPDAVEFHEAIHQALAGATVQTTMVVDGRVFDAQYTSLRDADGNPAGAIGVAIDVTQRDHAERAARDNEALLNLIFESAGVGICLVNREGRFVRVNAKYCDIYGYRYEELVGQSMTMLVPPENHDRLMQGHRAFLEGRVENPGNIQWRVLAKGGRSLDVSLTMARLVRADGELFLIATVADVTDLNRALAELREWEKRYEAAAMASGQILYDWDCKTDQVQFRGAVTEILGVSEETLGVEMTRFMDIMGVQNRTVMDAFRWERITSKEPYTLEYRVSRVDGGTAILQDHGRFILDDKGELLRMVGFIADITKAKQADAALHESRARYKAIVEDQTEMICRYRGDFVLTFVNDAFLRHYEGTRKEILGKSLLDLIPEAYRSTLVEQMRGMGPEAPLLVSEHPVPDVDLLEPPRWEQWTYRYLHDEAGNLIEFQAVGRDITDLKRAEQGLQQQTELFQTIIEHIPVVLIFSGADGKIRLVNREWEQVLGPPLPGASLRDVMASTVLDPLERYQLLEFLAEAKSGWRDFRIVGVDDHAWDFSWAVVRLSDGSRIGIGKDVTQSKRVQAELRAAKEAADSASQAKTAFLANMSHEIRTPLGAILGFANMMIGSGNERISFDRAARLIIQNGQHLLSILNGVLDLSKIEAGKLELDLVDYSPWRIVRETLAIFQVQAEHAHLTLTAVGQSPLPLSIRTDPTRVRQVLVNLVSNALKFTEAGAVTISLSLEIYPGTGGFTSVADRKPDRPPPPRPAPTPAPALAPAKRKGSETEETTWINREYNAYLLAHAGRIMTGGNAAVPADAGADADDEPESEFAAWPSENWLLRFTVTDTGIGISPDQIERLFQAFQQGDPSMTRTRGGTGLGLSISRRLAREMGGDLSVQSVFGQGSTFIFEIPVSNDDLKDLELHDLHWPGMDEPALPLSIQDGIDIRKLGLESGYAIGAFAPENIQIPTHTENSLRGCILLVEDVQENQEVLAHYLSVAALEVEFAENGLLALEKVAERGRPYDLILMDMAMPVMDGYTAVKQLRRQGYKGPIVALTAHAMANDRILCLNAGCDDYLSKPVPRGVLLAVVSRYVGGIGAIPESPPGDVAAPEGLPIPPTHVPPEVTEPPLPEVPALGSSAATPPVQADPAAPAASEPPSAFRQWLDAPAAAPVPAPAPVAPVPTTPDVAEVPQASAAAPPAEAPTPAVAGSAETGEVVGEPLVSRHMLDPGFDVLLIKYGVQLQERILTLENAFQADDRATLKKIAHQIKGSGGMYGYPLLSELAARLEMSHNAETALVSQCLDDLRNAITRVLRGLPQNPGESSE